MASPDSLGASGRYLEIELSAGPPTYPILFREAFSAAFPDDPTLVPQAVSRWIIAVGGDGDLELLSAAPGSPPVPLPFVEGQREKVQAIGINSQPSGITSVRVYL